MIVFEMTFAYFSALMIGAAGVGKTAKFLYPNIEYCCASGMSFAVSDTKGDILRSYAPIAEKYYGYDISVLDLRNPTQSDGFNMLHRTAIFNIRIQKFCRFANARGADHQRMDVALIHDSGYFFLFSKFQNFAADNDSLM